MRSTRAVATAALLGALTAAIYAQAAKVPTGKLHVAVSVTSALIAFQDTISQIIQFELEQQVAQGALAVQKNRGDRGWRTRRQSRRWKLARRPWSPMRILLLFDVRETSDSVTMALTWCDVDAAARRAQLSPAAVELAWILTV